MVNFTKGKVLDILITGPAFAAEVKKNLSGMSV
jgi:hypothetical protein